MSPFALAISRCSESRVPAEQVLGCQPGEIFVHRSIANVVAYNDVNTAAVLQYSIEHLKIQDILVRGHYGCGGVKASCEEYVVGGYIGDWLMIIGWTRRWVLERFKNRVRFRRLVRIFSVCWWRKTSGCK